MALEPPSPLNMESQPLDFEKPIFELQRRLQDLKNHSDEHELDFDSEVEAMENKIRETRREIYENLTAWQRVQIARHMQRPFALDYISRCFTEWVELHGDGFSAMTKRCRAVWRNSVRIAASSSRIKKAATRRRM